MKTPVQTAFTAVWGGSKRILVNTVGGAGGRPASGTWWSTRSWEISLIRADVLAQRHRTQVHTECVPVQPGDIETTFADTSRQGRGTGVHPSTPLRDGLRASAEWYGQTGCEFRLRSALAGRRSARRTELRKVGFVGMLPRGASGG